MAKTTKKITNNQKAGKGLSDFKKTKPRYYITTGRTGGGMLPNSSGGVNEPLSGRGQLDKAIQEKDLNTLIHLKHNKK